MESQSLRIQPEAFKPDPFWIFLSWFCDRMLETGIVWSLSESLAADNICKVSAFGDLVIFHLPLTSKNNDQKTDVDERATFII